MTTSQVSLPSPRTWSANDLVTVPRLRADVVNAVALLAQRPYFVGQRSLGDSWTAGSDLALPLDVELTDAWNGHLAPPATGTAPYWCPLPGWYLCDARVPFNYTSATAVSFECGFSGLTGGVAFGPVRGALTVNGSTSGTIIPRAVDLIQQTVSGAPGGSGDFIQATARQDSGGSVNLQSLAQCQPTVSIRWVCANSGSIVAQPPLTPVPTPITSAWLNANVRDTIRFLSYPPIMKAHYTAGTSTIPNNSLAAPAVVNLTTVDVDNYGNFTTGAAAKYTAPYSGRYFFAGQISFAASSTATTYACGLLVNGTTLYYGGIVRFAGTSQAGGASVTKRLRLTFGDTVQLVAVQQSGAALAYNASAGNQTRMIAVWEGL